MVQTTQNHYVDVHAHLTHEKFAGDLEPVIQRAQAAGLGAIIVNGLEPESNRAILKMAETHHLVKPAYGIYPIDAVNDILPSTLPFPVRRFDVQAAIQEIEVAASQGKLIAIGECGLDGHWVGAETFAAQERVLERLADIALRTKLPMIVHSRDLEQRTMDLLRHLGVKRVNFHCFGGKVKLAQHGAEHDGWWFSIPANATVNQAFRKMLSVLPPERILTETDCPYLSPRKGERNEPAHVVGTVTLMAAERGWSVEQARDQVWKNYCELFDVG